MNTQPDLISALNAIPAKGHIPSAPSSVFSCVTDEHLRGFTPLARYGQIIEVTKYEHATYRRRRTSPAYRLDRYAVDWLLLARDGVLYVDRLAGSESRGYGLNRNPPKLVDVLLPSAVYDFFKLKAGALWPNPLD